MWWEDVSGTLLVGLVLAYAGHRLSSGGRRRLRLDEARRELEIASLLLEHDERRADKLRRSAAAKVDGYLVASGPERHSARYAWLLATVISGVFIWTVLALLPASWTSEFWVQLLTGAVGAAVWNLLYDWSRPRFLRVVA